MPKSGFDQSNCRSLKVYYLKNELWLEIDFGMFVAFSKGTSLIQSFQMCVVKELQHHETALPKESQ